MSSRKNAKQTPCFICGNTAFEKRFGEIRADGGVYSVVFCKACGLGRSDPFLDEESLKRIYSSTYREDDSTRFFAPLEKLVRILRVRRCKEVERFAKKGTILDVGCGRGDFLALMKDRGWMVSGLDLDKRIAGHGRKTGMDLRHGGLEDARFPDNSFDAVTFWHVFEHLRNPYWALKECYRILRPDGLLVVAVPNIDSWQARLTGKGWFHLDPPFHLYHYSSKNLAGLLRKAGFEVSRAGHFSIEYNPYGFLQSVFNSLGLRANLFYDFLRSKWKKDAVSRISLALTVLSMPLVLPVSILFSVVEAMARRGGTIELYARKKEV